MQSWPPTLLKTFGGITRLGLMNFRNYTETSLLTDTKHIVLSGANGIGKTNILEAVSLLAPGRGLRNARPADWITMAAPGQDWGVSITLADGQRLTTRAVPDKPSDTRRLILHDGVKLSSQAKLSEFLAIVWLTPQMDGLFLGDAAARRKFIDRLVYAFDPEHAARIYRYEYALRQRNRLLKENAAPALLRSLHPVLVENGVAIAAARLENTAQLTLALRGMDSQFPLPLLEWSGDVEMWLSRHDALTVEEMYRNRLESDLPKDALIGQTRFGIHRSDVLATHNRKHIPAAQCSTGEQKALLLSLVLAHAQWLKHVQPDRPLVLLMDDIAAHLDVNRRRDVFEWIAQLPIQAWFTGTDAKDFAPLHESKSLFFNLPL